MQMKSLEFMCWGGMDLSKHFVLSKESVQRQMRREWRAGVKTTVQEKTQGQESLPNAIIPCTLLDTSIILLEVNIFL